MIDFEQGKLKTLLIMEKKRKKKPITIWNNKENPEWVKNLLMRLQMLKTKGAQIFLGRRCFTLTLTSKGINEMLIMDGNCRVKVFREFIDKVAYRWNSRFKM